MKKYQFSQVGIDAMQADIYSLQDAAVASFAAEIARDFKAWAVSYFNLTASQVNDLTNLHEQTSTFLALQGSFAVRNRRPIHLIKPVHPGNSGKEDKIIKLGGTLFAVSNREGAFKATGALIIEISYHPKKSSPGILIQEELVEH